MKIIQPSPTSVEHATPLTRMAERKFREYDAHNWSAEVIVTAVIHELEMVVARSENPDLEIHLADKVPGVHWRELSMGQHLRVKLVGVLAPLVVSAETVSDFSPRSGSPTF